MANLTRSMALELGPQGILVNAVAPGSTLTRGTEALFYGPDGAYTEKAASLLSHIPIGTARQAERDSARGAIFGIARSKLYQRDDSRCGRRLDRRVTYAIGNH